MSLGNDRNRDRVAYRHTRHDLKESAFPLLRESQVVVDVHELSGDENRQILYNHLKLGKQPQAFRRSVKSHLEAVADHPRFVPEIARRLSDPLFTQELPLIAFRLDQFVERREQLLQDVLQGLDRHSKAALAVIYMRKDTLESPVTLEPMEEEAVRREEFVPRLRDVRYRLELDHRADDSAEEHLQPVLDSLEILKKRFADDQRVVEIIDREAGLAQQWVAENVPEEPKRKPRELGDVAKQNTPRGTTASSMTSTSSVPASSLPRPQCSRKQLDAGGFHTDAANQAQMSGRSKFNTFRSFKT